MYLYMSLWYKIIYVQTVIHTMYFICFSVSIFPISTLHNSILFPTAYCFYVHTSKFNSFSLFSIITNFIILFLSVLSWSLLYTHALQLKNFLQAPSLYSCLILQSCFHQHVLYIHASYFYDLAGGCRSWAAYVDTFFH